DLTEACLAAGDLERALQEADLAIELTGATDERTWRTLALEVSARAALASGDGERAARDVEIALATVGKADVPLAEWRAHATAARVHRLRGDLQNERRHAELCRAAVCRLADSLASRPALQQRFVSAARVFELAEDAYPRTASGSA